MYTRVYVCICEIAYWIEREVAPIVVPAREETTMGAEMLEDTSEPTQYYR